jgi:energy-converting hydrogenase Eha subunit E
MIIKTLLMNKDGENFMCVMVTYAEAITPGWFEARRLSLPAEVPALGGAFLVFAWEDALGRLQFEGAARPDLLDHAVQRRPQPSEFVEWRARV